MSKEFALPKTIIIIGAALAGPVAASRAREIDGKARIILLERNTRVSYAMAGLSFHLSGEVKSLDDLNREREDYFKRVYNIEVHTKTEVTKIDSKNKILYLNSSDDLTELKYDTLIFATGAASIHPTGLPKTTQNFRYFRTLDDLAEIQRHIKTGKNKILVLGGGSMGIEAVDGCVRGGAEVTLIEKSDQILPGFTKNIATMAEHMMSSSISIYKNVQNIEYISKNDLVSEVIIDGKKIKIDFIVSAIGVRPRTELLAQTGVKLHKDGTIKINSYCQTNIKDIYACSICVSLPTRFGHMWIPQAAVSDKTAQVAGANAAGSKVKLREFSSSMIIRTPNAEVGKVGLSQTQAQMYFGKDKIGKALVHGTDKESYFPTNAPVILEILYHKKNHRILGLSALGNNIKSRLDAFASAFTNRQTLEDIANLDFAYSPAFGTSRDVLNVVATVALQKESKLTESLEPIDLLMQRKNFFILDVGSQPTNTVKTNHFLPVESIRTMIPELLQKFKASGATTIATLSESGRRGHLAYRILKEHHIPVININGGIKLYSLYANKT